VKAYRFVLADVFTDERFGGNQLAVFTDARGLEPGLMQKIAREMNFSETTFLFPAERDGDYRVRIFTPHQELPFAGHPIVGTAHVIVAEGLKPAAEPATSVTLETGVGLIPVEVATVGGAAGHTTMTQPIPELRGSFTDIARLAGALALEPSEIHETGLPVEALHNGITVLIVPVATRAAVERARPIWASLEEISKEVGASTVLVFALEALMPASSAHCRVFAPAAGVLEDAATGSANGPLGAYMVRHRAVAPQSVTRIISEQGFEMNRPSLLHIEVAVDLETNHINRVRVGGGVVIAGRGEMLVD